MSPPIHALLAAAAETPHFFAEIAAILVMGAVIAYVAFRFGLVPIVGFLLAGVLIGPSGLGFVRDRALVDAAAEVGVILLLFTIGIEFSMQKLSRIKRLIFIGGGLQVVLASVLTMGLLAALGVAWKSGLYTGFLLALSSTAIVLKLLADRGETNSDQGQAALGILIFQDLAVVAMVLVVPMMGGAGGSALDVGVALGKAALIIALVLLFARRVMPRIVEAVARTCSPEIFLLTIIAICFGTAYLTSLAGVSLSLGAFLAGLVVSESPFSEHALGEILPLQILFSATFFISVGMLLDLGFLVQHLPLVLAAIALVLLIKLLTTGAAVAVLRQRPAITAATALMLAQVGEFSFVLERVGGEVGLFPAGLAQSGSQAFIAASVLLMVGTPALSAAGGLLSRRLERNAGAAAKASMEDAHDAEVSYENAENHVIVAGFGRAARQLVNALSNAGIPFVITTLSPAGANEAEEARYRVLRGDSSRQRTLQLAGTERAKMLVIADDDPAMAERIAAVARTLNPTMRLVVRTRYESEVKPLHVVGTDRVITEELESVLQVFAEVLRTYRIAPAEIEAREEVIRQGDYAGLVADAAPAAMAACNLDADCLDTRTVVVRATAAAAGSTIGSLDLGHRFGIAVDRVRHNGTVLSGTELDFVLTPGDELDLRGAAESFASAAELFRVTRADAEAPETAVATRTEEIDMEKTIELKPDPKTRCQHASSIRVVTPSARGCEDCLKTGSWWVHLRICMTCGHVGCCDSSPNKHATKHWQATTHPIVRSLEKGEEWGWCFADQEML
jgi:CPA2 family monovalent cation:H+ antiporter-2